MRLAGPHPRDYDARMKNKRAGTAAEAVAEVFEGATILVGGFGVMGIPGDLLDAVGARGVGGLTVVANGTGADAVVRLIERGLVKKMICNFPVGKKSAIFRKLLDAGKIELELVPQGTMAERMRTAGAGLGGFLTRTGLGTEIAEGKPHVTVDGVEYLLEKPLPGDFAFVHAECVDPLGNLTFRYAARNFNPVIAMAAKRTIVQARREVPLGDLAPDVIVTPGIYVDRYWVQGGA